MIRALFSCLYIFTEVDSHGLLLLYKPRDISSDCTSSQRLRFDISFGMGMSDTLTLVFRTNSEADYECDIDIATDPYDISIITVIKYPTSVSVNCGANPDAFTVMKKQRCIRVCDSIAERDMISSYFVAAVKGRMRFRFLSNSSINADINAKMYQVTVTTARAKPSKGCAPSNETLCSVGNSEFCLTTGVVCDGINNCGMDDWFDERKSDCNLPIEKLGYAPVIAVSAGILCALLAAGHVLLRCLPPLANSFFIFNANEDNRLCIDPMFKSPGTRSGSIEKVKRVSLIPVSSSTSCTSDSENHDESAEGKHRRTVIETTPRTSEEHGKQEYPKRKTTIKSMTEKLQKKFRAKQSAGVMHF